jgi:UDP-4-amino-4-deoxy-L-arabinose formyltransferase/UDP-glucuronic acid dehydrogenase (UDP-4-keto-hexauronic acid decarboxylating)
MKVVLCGYNWIGCKVLDSLLENGHQLYVYTHDNPPHVNSLIEYCEKRGIDYSLKKIKADNLPFKPDIICSIYYRYIIDEHIIDLVDKKVFNLHPSLLPQYKGCSSLTWAMINGENETGFTYHYLTSRVDSGNIILQKKILIEDWDTQVTLYHRVMFEAAKFFKKAFNLVKNGYVGIQQKNGGKYYKRETPHNGIINGRWNLQKKERFIRAMNYPPLPYAKYKNQEVKTFREFLDIKNYK